MIKAFIGVNRRASEWLMKKFPRFFGTSESYHDDLMDRIFAAIKLANKQVEEKLRILEAGGIDRPLLEKSQEYGYVGIDIESKEQCYEIYDEFIVQSIEKPLDDRFDLIISKTLLEHVPDNKAAINVIFEALLKGGATHHYVPSKRHPYSMALLLIGPRLQKKLIPLLRPAAVEVTGYPAFFNHCSVDQMKNLFEATGFENVDIKAYYRANDYFAFFTPLFILETAFENLCRLFKIKYFASGFVISGTKR